jgi:hypothetical protein
MDSLEIQSIMTRHKPVIALAKSIPDILKSQLTIKKHYLDTAMHYPNIVPGFKKPFDVVTSKIERITSN